MESLTLLFMLIALGLTIISACKKHAGMVLYFLQALISASALILIVHDVSMQQSDLMMLMLLIPFACLGISISGLVNAAGDKHGK